VRTPLYFSSELLKKMSDAVLLDSAISSSTGVDKKKIKKWTKKVEKGEIQNAANYLLCRYSYNLLVRIYTLVLLL
jgi:hypothetical protein